jgi:biotin transporter BioY
MVWLRRFRFHFVLAWVSILVMAHWRLGLPRTGLDEFLALATQALCFPGSLLAVALLAFTRIDPHFWDTRAGITVGWAIFFAAGYLQWFVFVPWLAGKLRKHSDPGKTTDVS